MPRSCWSTYIARKSTRRDASTSKVSLNPPVFRSGTDPRSSCSAIHFLSYSSKTMESDSYFDARSVGIVAGYSQLYDRLAQKTTFQSALAKHYRSFTISDGDRQPARPPISSTSLHLTARAPQ